jgi:hypothetical protein
MRDSGSVQADRPTVPTIVVSTPIDMLGKPVYMNGPKLQSFLRLAGEPWRINKFGCRQFGAVDNLKFKLTFPDSEESVVKDRFVPLLKPSFMKVEYQTLHEAQHSTSFAMQRVAEEKAAQTLVDGVSSELPGVIQIVDKSVNGTVQGLAGLLSVNLKRKNNLIERGEEVHLRKKTAAVGSSAAGSQQGEPSESESSDDDEVDE